MHPLDRPVWSSLTTHHAGLSEGDGRARRFLRDINLFASARDDQPDALQALSELVGSGESVFILQVPAIVRPPELTLTKSALGVQMVVADRRTREYEATDIVKLTDADAPEMLALARLTEPGPFLARTHRMGTFLGIRVGERLAAMAGERMRFPGYTEVSGVCTHPDFRGRGYARRLSTAVTAAIEARGEQPFLHAWKTNVAAISLYEALGFRIRCDVNVAVLSR